MNEIEIPHPNKRATEFPCIRIYEDDRIEEIIDKIERLHKDLVTIKKQISAHDYNIMEKFK